MLVSGGSLRRTDQLIQGKEIWKYVHPAIASEIGFFLKKSNRSEVQGSKVKVDEKMVTLNGEP